MVERRALIRCGTSNTAYRSQIPANCMLVSIDLPSVHKHCRAHIRFQRAPLSPHVAPCPLVRMFTKSRRTACRRTTRALPAGFYLLICCLCFAKVSAHFNSDKAEEGGRGKKREVRDFQSGHERGDDREVGLDGSRGDAGGGEEKEKELEVGSKEWWKREKDKASEKAGRRVWAWELDAPPGECVYVFARVWRGEEGVWGGKQETARRHEWLWVSRISYPTHPPLLPPLPVAHTRTHIHTQGTHSM